MNKTLADEINKLAKKDQQLRNNMPSDPSLQDAYWEKIEEFDLSTTIRLKVIVEEIALPTISKVGKTASNNAWLLVQHSSDLDFQKRYLQLLKLHTNDISLTNIAYLEDRILMYEGQPQIYGTQVVKDEKTNIFVPYRLSSPEDVDKRRAEYGLQNLETYLDTFSQ